MIDIILKLKEYEDLLKELQTYFYCDVVCKVLTNKEHRQFIGKINDVLYNPPTHKI